MMSVFLIIVFLSSNVGRSGGTIRPVVTFTPNWGNILVGDPVTLSCNMTSTVPEEPRTYHWYKDNQQIHRDQQSILIQNSVVQDSGEYRCNISGGDFSDPVFLNVTESYLILQRPPSAIYEGDPLTMRCRHTEGYTEINTNFYRDDKEIKSSNTDSELHIPKAELNLSGLYKCTKHVRHEESSQVHVLSDVFSMSVKELFAPPKIKVTLDGVIEGGDMNVTCDTSLDPLRAGTGLYFSFYRDGRSVREFSVSDTYRVRSAQLEDSGNYTCEVRTVTDTVRKRSDGFYIQILQDKKLPMTVITTVVIGVIIIIISAVLIWKCKKRKSFSHQEPHQATPTAVSNTGPDPQDVCYTYLDMSRFPKGNKIRSDELTVTYATVTNT